MSHTSPVKCYMSIRLHQSRCAFSMSLLLTPDLRFNLIKQIIEYMTKKSIGGNGDNGQTDENDDKANTITSSTDNLFPLVIVKSFFVSSVLLQTFQRGRNPSKRNDVEI